LFFEPIALDLAVYSAAWGYGESVSSQQVALRYLSGLGAQARF